AREPVDRHPSAAVLRRELAALRRYYDATPEAVAAWVADLRTGGAAHRRIDTDAEATELHLQAEDLEEVPELAEGSRRADPYDVEPPLVAPEPRVSRPRFVDADTVVSQSDATLDDRDER
ncbi:MAG: hypothetical protein ACM31C_33115, partial [Acidobacteriota bacterium]